MYLVKMKLLENNEIPFGGEEEDSEEEQKTP